MADKFYIVYETPIKAWVGSLAGMVTTLAIIGIGVALDSAAMQWFGFIFVWLIFFVMALQKGGRPRTRAEAIAELEKMQPKPRGKNDLDQPES